MPVVTRPLSEVHLPPELARDIDRDHVRRLAATLKAGGVLPPPLANPDGKIISGAHRYLAHVEAGRQTIDLQVPDKPFTRGEIKLDQWRENSNRLGFTIPEQAQLMLDLMKEYGWDQAELAVQLVISAAQVAKVLLISKRLAPDLQEKIVSGELLPKSAYSMSMLPDHAMQREVFAMKLPKCMLVEREVVRRLRLLGLAKREKRTKAVKGKTKNGTTYSFRADLTLMIEDLTSLLSAAKRAEKLGLDADSIKHFLGDKDDGMAGPVMVAPNPPRSPVPAQAIPPQQPHA
jgi:ParB-like chromosome segregation protein Spo0J